MKKEISNKYSNKEIAHLLRSVGAVYLIKGENMFKIIAYENAASAVERLTRELKDIWEDGKLEEVSGIGHSLASHLDELFRKGASSHFESILKRIPKSVFVLMRIPTLGPKKSFKLVTALKFFNEKTVVEDLKEACHAGKVAKIESFGEKSQQDILEAISLFEQRSSKEERMPLPYAFSIADDVLKYLKKNPAIERADALGSLRRMVTTIGDVDIAIQAKISKLKTQNLYEEIIKYFIRYPKKISVDNAGEKKASIIVSPNIRIDLRVQEKENYGSMLQYFTGSKAHNIKLREFALKKGYSLSEYGIKPIFGEIQISNIKNQKYNPKLKTYEFEDEKKFYNFLGLQYIPPEIREGTNEIELARKQSIPKLVERDEIKGDLHIHSSYDLKPSHDFGINTYEQIASYAKKLGYEYVGFSDHNPKISDLGEKKIIEIMKKRKDHIENIFSRERKSGVKHFIGLELDILPDGKIALPEKAIEYVDYLIVSVHSSFSQNIKQMTKRVLEAIKYPKVKILGHPTGRLLGKREGFELEWEKIFAYCKNKNIAVEINAWPERLDLPDTLVREALGNGVKFIINTDAHANEQMGNMRYGVSVARRGWCRKSDIINTLPYLEFKKWLNG